MWGLCLMLWLLFVWFLNLEPKVAFGQWYNKLAYIVCFDEAMSHCAVFQKSKVNTDPCRKPICSHGYQF